VCPGGGPLTCDDIANGYNSSLTSPEATNWFDPNAWGNAVDVYPNNTDSAGNRVRYIMHRLCAQPGPYNNPTPQQCAQYTPVGGAGTGSTMAVGSYQFQGIPQVYIRITTRVDGPRNTVSITQTAVLVDAS